ncbi:MAG: energy transducer TonB [Gemmatimonadales bacterium]
MRVCTFEVGAVILAGMCAAAGVGCRGGDQAAARREAQSRHSDVPVAINGESPFQYPTYLYDQGIEGEVRLRLWVDSTGRVAPESTRVASGSGTAGLDSAAMAGASQLQFAPAHQDGRPVGMAFYQPVIFRRRAAPNAPPAQ